MSKKITKRVLLISSLTIVSLFLLTLIFFSIFYHRAKLNIDQLTSSNSGIKIYASEYMEENASFYNLDRKIINIDDLHDYTVNAFVDIEDKRFYSHSGYDLKRIVKSSLVNLKTGTKQQGASTITQQLVKNTLLSNEKTYSRKINEIMLAIKVEKNFSKKEILNMYLNSIYFGSNAYGIENASNIYFNKSAKDISLNESAVLAGLIKSPKVYSPKRANNQKCIERKNLVLKQMLDNNHISKQEYNENILLGVECVNMNTNYDNSYYQQAIYEACKLLNISEKELIRNDYQIITFMDKEIQNILKQEFANNNISCDKLSIVANKQGEILGYLGSSNYDLSKMRRTPASTLKPFAVYLPCIVHNICNPSTPILDEEIDYNGYSPKNINNEYEGWISVEDALSKSKNTPSVKLLNCLGIDKSIKFLNKLGIHTEEDDKTLALSLGSLTNGISPIELLQAYTIFNNAGRINNLRFIDKILDKNGHVIYENKSITRQVCDAESAYLTNTMLMKTAKCGTAKKLACFDFEIASKTGTNYVDGKTLDLWNVAYTSNLLTLSWLGDANNEGLDNYSSSFHATNVNKNILSKIYSKSSPAPFEIPENIVTADIDLLEYENNHKLLIASENTPERYRQQKLFKIDNVPTISDSFYAKPNTNLELSLTNYGVKISFDTNEIFDYTIIKNACNKQDEIMKISNNNGSYSFIDDKVFSLDKVDYILVTTNKYTFKSFEEKQTVYPKNYLLGQLKNNETLYNSKKRWYV